MAALGSSILTTWTTGRRILGLACGATLRTLLGIVWFALFVVWATLWATVALVMFLSTDIAIRLEKLGERVGAWFEGRL